MAGRTPALRPTSQPASPLTAVGKGVKFTRSNPPVRVLCAQAFASKSEALKAEAALKKLDRTEKLAWARKTLPISDGILDRAAT